MTTRPMFSRRAYDNIAFLMRVERQFLDHDLDIASDAHWAAVRTWDRQVDKLCQLFLGDNTRFKPDYFKVACGYTRRPDGAMYHVEWRGNRLVLRA